MKSVMNAEGILTVDIPVPTPAYNALPAVSGQFAATMPPPPALSQAAVAMDAAAVANLPAQFQTTGTCSVTPSSLYEQNLCD